MEATREAEWITVRNEAGATGLVPRAYVDSIASSPAGQSTGSGSGAAALLSAEQWPAGPADPYAVSWDEPAPESAAAASVQSAPRTQQQQQTSQRSSVSAKLSSSLASPSPAAPTAGEDVYESVVDMPAVSESLSASSTPLPTPGPASKQQLPKSDSSRSLDSAAALSKFNIVKV